MPFWRWLVLLLLAVAIPLIFTISLFRLLDWPTEDSMLWIDHDVDRATVRETGYGDGVVETIWRKVSLPYRCPSVNGLMLPNKATDCRETFRLTFQYDPGETRLWSVYAPSFLGNLSISLNGSFLASSLWQQSEAEVIATLPVLIPLPRGLLRPGANQVEITLSRWGIVSGFLGRIGIGPDVVFRSNYDTRMMLFSTLRRMTEGWQLALGMTMLVMWLTRPKEVIFFIFGATLVLLSVQPIVNLFSESVDERALRFSNLSRLMAGFFILPLTWQVVGRPSPIPLKYFVLMLGLFIIFFVVAPLNIVGWTIATFIFPLVLIGIIWAFWVICWEAVVARQPIATLMVGVSVILMYTAFRDWLALRGDFGPESGLIGRLPAPIYLLVTSGALIWRFGQALNILDRLSTRLRSEVEAAEDALRRSFARERIQERKVILESERVRLMSDLHDGIAGQLVSILALSELKGRGNDEVSEAARAALVDLRLVVASLEDVGDDLGIMLALFRERIEPQLAALNIQLVWRAADTPNVPGLHPGAALAIFRILQEGAINAAKHSGAPEITIEAGLSPLPGYGVRLMVRDQGRGGVGERMGGYGLSNMRRRAVSIGAALNINSDDGGTVVTLDLPQQFS